MRICAAQTRPITGDVPANIERHNALIDLAVSQRADVVIFPELSLTGYEPRLVKELATNPDDKRLDDFQRISDTSQITIGVGIPTSSDAGIRISMVIFQPHQARHVYSKGYLHPDEDEYFVGGPSSPDLRVSETNIALAICFEISVPQHLETALKSGPEIYFASVAKFVKGAGKAMERLSDIAKTHSVTVMMANSVGPSDGDECAGKTSIWNRKGELVGQLNDANEGILMFDTETQEVVGKTI
jgi:predicted amidohydrolase